MTLQFKGLAREATAREIAVLELAAAGYSNAQIGSRLGISLDTVKRHLQRTSVKLGVFNSRAGLVAAAFRAGLLE